MEEKDKTNKFAAVSEQSDSWRVDRSGWATRVGVPMEILKSADFRVEYPFESHLHNIAGHNYHYLDEGEGEPVVMVHGNPTWSFFYRNLILGLRGAHRCLAADHMGCGFSEKPQRYDYTLERHIANLEDWLEAVLPAADAPGGRINLVVHDWGGPIGIGYALRHAARIKRLIVLNTSAFTAGVMPAGIRFGRLPVVGALAIRGLNLFAKIAAAKTTVRPLSRQVKSFFVLPYNSWKNRIAVNAFVQDIPLEPTGPTRTLLQSIGDNVAKEFARTPMLIQWGMADWCFTPFFLGLWRQNFPNAEVDEYDAGHYLLEDAGDRIIERIKAYLERPTE